MVYVGGVMGHSYQYSPRSAGGLTASGTGADGFMNRPGSTSCTGGPALKLDSALLDGRPKSAKTVLPGCGAGAGFVSKVENRESRDPRGKCDEDELGDEISGGRMGVKSTAKDAGSDTDTRGIVLPLLGKAAAVVSSDEGGSSTLGRYRPSEPPRGLN